MHTNPSGFANARGEPIAVGWEEPDWPFLSPVGVHSEARRDTRTVQGRGRQAAHGRGVRRHSGPGCGPDEWVAPSPEHGRRNPGSTDSASSIYGSIRRTTCEERFSCVSISARPGCIGHPGAVVPARSQGRSGRSVLVDRCGPPIAGEVGAEDDSVRRAGQVAVQPAIRGHSAAPGAHVGHAPVLVGDGAGSSGTQSRLDIPTRRRDPDPGRRRALSVTRTMFWDTPAKSSTPEEGWRRRRRLRPGPRRRPELSSTDRLHLSRSRTCGDSCR